MSEPQITYFRDSHFFLSNYYELPLYFEGAWYPTAEHAFQAAKTTNEEMRTAIRKSNSPAKAKRMGRNLTLRPRWDSMRVEVMRTILRSKFKDMVMRGMLMSTGDADLIEGNTWGDTFWGVCRGRGQNTLGQLLMEIRQEIKEGKL